MPCRDLVAKIELDSPSTVVDLGCGPGNSTSVLYERWPNSKVVGIDNSEEMLTAARESNPHIEWRLDDISIWDPRHPVDLIFSNAALQWVPGQEALIPRLFSLVGTGGALAFQIPSGDGAWAEAARDIVAGSGEWRALMGLDQLDLHTHGLGFYYGLLSSSSSRMDLWETSYVHVLPNHEAIVEWTKGTAIRPVLERIPTERREAFLGEYTEAVRAAYPSEKDGKVLFPFLRRFVVAYR